MNFRVLFRHWRTILVVAEMTLRQQMVDGFVIFTILFQPLIIALLGLFMLKDRGPDAAMFVVVGSVLTGLWSCMLFVSGNSLDQERWTGTLEALVAIPTPFEVIAFGKNLANVVLSLGSMIVGYIAAAYIFGYSLEIQQPLMFIVSLLLSVVAFISFSLVILPIFMMNPGVRAWRNAMEFPVYVICGFLFPVALLPDWTTPISYLLPPYWAAVALHGTSTGGAAISSTFFAWTMMLLFSIIDLFIAARLFKIMLYRVRVDATLGME